ncbi:hypothetical protein COEREDRAFT_82617 [Coemansia reversa NRRL 1564]|uniref:Thioredoxin-like fold domain-containing protein n=1 Tax=Coemansia reversa (strain ATCC 12441 / NRRL 1564) TaxID=763665 RepID=A0A2G5B6D6_COERN|nr:hypothetical protein COEREDRAFT_82617 [Coemansia reversa NRRL 1564]|eukprot:PIA14586.1 hypothetical protein COEREDRAFT_82617 [Coemansia reversa NRRL 1564]
MATPEAPLREILKTISFTQLPLRYIEPFFKAETISTPRLYVYGLSKTGNLFFQNKNKLPTYDVECLRTLTLLKFAKYDFDIAYTNESNGSPNGKLPYLLLPNGEAIDKDNIQEHLEKSGYGVSKGDLSDELAYLVMVERNILPAIEYMVWVDSAGYEVIGTKRYLYNYPQPIRYLIGWIKSSEIAKTVRIGQPEYGAALDNEVLCDNVIRTFESLLVLLGNREYLAGKPSLLDALVSACLNIILEAPLKSPIRSVLLPENSKFKPLVDYALRILQSHLEIPEPCESNKEVIDGSS